MIYLYPDVDELLQNGKCNVVIYGGSFSPVTTGHMSVITNVMTAFPSNTICYLVPIIDDWIVKNKGCNRLVTKQHRVAMCELAIEDIKIYHPNWNLVVTSFWDTEVDNSLLEYYHTLYPQSNICYLCGTDVYNSFCYWSQCSQQALSSDRFNLIVYPRNDDDISSTHVYNIYQQDNKLTHVIDTVAQYILDNNLMSTK